MEKNKSNEELSLFLIRKTIAKEIVKKSRKNREKSGKIRKQFEKINQMKKYRFFMIRKTQVKEIVKTRGKVGNNGKKSGKFGKNREKSGKSGKISGERRDLEAVVVGLFAVVGAAAEAVATVVHGRVAHEAVLQRLVALLVPLEVADHLLLLHEDARVAVQTVEVLPGGEKKGKETKKI